MFEIKLGKYSVFAVLTIALFAVTSFSQAGIKTPTGYLFIKNGKDKSYTMEINGNNITALKSPTPAFSIAGKIFQILSVPISNFTDKKMTDIELLEKHKIWESDYLSERFKEKLTIDSEKLTFGERKALFWGFTRPTLNQQYDRDYYMSTVIGSSLLVLSSPIKIGENKADYQTFLSDMMKTVKVSDKPFDIAKMAEDIKKSN